MISEDADTGYHGADYVDEDPDEEDSHDNNPKKRVRQSTSTKVAKPAEHVNPLYENDTLLQDTEFDVNNRATVNRLKAAVKAEYGLLTQSTPAGPTRDAYWAALPKVLARIGSFVQGEQKKILEQVAVGLIQQLRAERTQQTATILKLEQEKTEASATIIALQTQIAVLLDGGGI